MSVIVKGVDAPSDCDGCWHPTCNLWIGTDAGKRHKDCPISPLPENHGRLIDADALDCSLGISDEDIDMHFRLEECETIVEAEGE